MCVCVCVSVSVCMASLLYAVTPVFSFLLCTISHTLSHILTYLHTYIVHTRTHTHPDFASQAPGATRIGHCRATGPKCCRLVLVSGRSDSTCTPQTSVLSLRYIGAVPLGVGGYHSNDTASSPAPRASAPTKGAAALAPVACGRFGAEIDAHYRRCCGILWSNC
ncbi:hypothetical protein COCSADRAFT_308504 [Bipolaris sorokiniana ND90Pr]|uniref:Uncharacterized protein n=1 Tax=Cochliobolus sativus (strain ND90Pr / ATCC 201652) TaxID=665912 RepID=M2T8W0_COCSN|nr:uncharacterized protein COCSADRAFT_308504 [Bipolaris sorokiniana ND90Pr]EMD65686.1 hypothetical protein COCSADRAFT_308504 [Bipolaris sorokiniana ND90Pr]